MVLSDGWETGAPEVLGEALATLRRRAGRLVWLNPLLGSPGYEPLTRGMQAAHSAPGRFRAGERPGQPRAAGQAPQPLSRAAAPVQADAFGSRGSWPAAPTPDDAVAPPPELVLHRAGRSSGRSWARRRSASHRRMRRREGSQWPAGGVQRPRRGFLRARGDGRRAFRSCDRRGRPLDPGRNARNVNGLTSQRLTDSGAGSTFYDNRIDVRA